jgi:hypothetical protein
MSSTTWIFRRTNNSCGNPEPLAKRIAALKQRCKKAVIPTIYVNDNNERFPAYEPPLVITAQARSSEQRKLAKNG